MPNQERDDNGVMHIASAEEVRHFVGPVSDHTVADILGLAPTREDLEVAVVYLEGEGEVAGIEGHSLAGKAARICELLSADDLYRADEA
jgi:hypothetical protein